MHVCCLRAVKVNVTEFYCSRSVICTCLFFSTVLIRCCGVFWSSYVWVLSSRGLARASSLSHSFAHAPRFFSCSASPNCTRDYLSFGPRGAWGPNGPSG
jgi:hypothetical protein